MDRRFGESSRIVFSILVLDKTFHLHCILVLLIFWIRIYLTHQPNDPFSEPQHSLEHEIDKGTAEEDSDEGDGHVFLQVADGGFVTGEIAFDELQITTVGPAEDIEDITDEEGDEAYEDVPQRVVDDGKGEGNGFCHKEAEHNEGECHQCRDEIADSGRKQKAENGVQIIGVHPLGNALKRAVKT